MEKLKKYQTDYNNISPSILKHFGKNLHNKKNHPICILKNFIYQYFNKFDTKFNTFDTLSPVVSIEDNFDKLLIPKDHPARAKRDTYYVSEKYVLRTQTSSHQNELLANGYKNFLVTGDVYRKDEIDRTHYPIFHQMEGVIEVISDDPIKELKNILFGLVEHLFPNCEYRLNDDYFPFTNPSFEIEVKYDNKWLEILGCGVMHENIIKNNKLDGKQFLAFGLGLERLCMLAFRIPDIRYFWSDHPKFVDQFIDGKIVEFKPYTKLPNQKRDVTIVPKNDRIEKNLDKEKKNTYTWFDENNFFELIRERSNDYIESTTFIGDYKNPKNNVYSRTYSMLYSPKDPSITNSSELTELCNKIQNNIIDELVNKFEITIK